jgi:hypothetical protein
LAPLRARGRHANPRRHWRSLSSIHITHSSVRIPMWTIVVWAGTRFFGTFLIATPPLALAHAPRKLSLSKQRKRRRFRIVPLRQSQICAPVRARVPHNPAIFNVFSGSRGSLRTRSSQSWQSRSTAWVGGGLPQARDQSCDILQMEGEVRRRAATKSRSTRRD